MLKRFPRPKNPFTAVCNEALNDRNISLAAKGLYAYMLAQPDHEPLTIKKMASSLKEDVTSISAKVEELKNHGWIECQQLPDGSSKQVLLYGPKNENPTRLENDK